MRSSEKTPGQGSSWGGPGVVLGDPGGSWRIFGEFLPDFGGSGRKKKSLLPGAKIMKLSGIKYLP